MPEASSEPLSAPLAALQAEDSARKAVEGAHSLFHVRPSVAAADALEAALQEWKRTAAPALEIAQPQNAIEVELLNLLGDTDDIHLAYYDGGLEVDAQKLADKLACWAHARDAVQRRAALLEFASRLRGRYTLNFSSPTALLDQIAALAERDADLGI